ncbi:MAG: murein DD-endopeptidase MepM/ murein hydrolase activator NlpD [Alphaproteobacteria bacterium]|jgi:murein DD-endopeptidase MepM/ murein hydrolase activator NlpD
MSRSNIILALVGCSVVALSACAPRNSLRQAAIQNQPYAQNARSVNNAPSGNNGLPLYQSASAQNVMQSNNLPAVDYRSTGTTTQTMTAAPIPAMSQAPAATYNRNYVANDEMRYNVQKGETIYSIGRKFNTHPKQIIARNQMMNPNSLSVGDALILPKRQATPVNNANAPQYDNSLYTGSITNNNTNITPQSVPIYPKNAVIENTQMHHYTVQPGDTMYSIGRKFNVHPNYIINKNPSVMPSQLQPGQVLNMVSNNASVEQKKNIVQTPKFVAKISPPAQVIPKKTVSQVQSDDLQKQILANALSLPVQGAIKENKNMRGILITATDGDAVKASAAGEVIYVGNLNNYGNMVLVRHDNGLVTNYARLKKTFVQKGQKVDKGDLIASAGTSKDFQNSDVLFEVRKGTKAVNPLDYIG